MGLCLHLAGGKGWGSPMTYPWTEAEKRDMRPGTPLRQAAQMGCHIFVLFEGQRGGECAVRHASGVVTGVDWRHLEPVTTPTAPPLSAQERELFERRSKELVQVRRDLDHERQKNGDHMRSLSHVLHENEKLEKRVKELGEKLEAELARLKAAPTLTELNAPTSDEVQP